MLEEFAGPVTATPLWTSRGWTRVLLVMLTVLASAVQHCGLQNQPVLTSAVDQPCVAQANQTHHPENILTFI
jgi:hypothetical protein